MATHTTTGDPSSHPLVQGTACPNCKTSPGRLAIATDYFLYLRCQHCAHIWTMPERRSRKRLDDPAA